LSSWRGLTRGPSIRRAKDLVCVFFILR
jgi:hypothetical protein